MKSVAGIFVSRKDAEDAVTDVHYEAGVPKDRITLLTPDTSKRRVPTSDSEQPGVGKALGGTVGAAIGVAAGLELGAAAAASLFVPGVGPVLAFGLIGAALLGSSGAFTGMVAGEALDDKISSGLPHDEVFVYEDALRKGRSVVVAMAEDDDRVEAMRVALEENGAESIDSARNEWWIGLRDDEEARYSGGDFKTDEPVYRRGFVAALDPQARGKSFDEALDSLKRKHGEECNEECFRHGYERGQDYREKLLEKRES
jgi:hypothetical protein